MTNGMIETSVDNPNSRIDKVLSEVSVDLWKMPVLFVKVYE